MAATDADSRQFRSAEPQGIPHARIFDVTLRTRRRPVGHDPTHDPYAGRPKRFGQETPAPRARISSVKVVGACVRYAVSVRYQRVMLSDLSAASGVSERRVRDAFCDCYGMSPTAYLRIAALFAVRRALTEDPSARDAVTRAASDFGFWHLGRFAGYYRALFGESPSETVARARTRAESGDRGGRGRPASRLSRSAAPERANT